MIAKIARQGFREVVPENHSIEYVTGIDMGLFAAKVSFVNNDIHYSFSSRGTWTEEQEDGSVSTCWLDENIANEILAFATEKWNR